MGDTFLIGNKGAPNIKNTSEILELNVTESSVSRNTLSVSKRVVTHLRA